MLPVQMHPFMAGSWVDPAMVKVGSFTNRSGTGVQTISGVGFRPKALLLFWDLAADDAFATTGPGTGGVIYSGIAAYGGTLVTQQLRGVDGGTSLNQTTQGVALIDDGSSSTISAGSLTLLADGFSIQWLTNPFASAGLARFFYVAFGGTVSAASGAFTSPSGATTTTTSVTAPGFQPDLVVLFEATSGGASTNTPAQNVLGFVTASTQVASISNAGANATAWGTTYGWVKQANGKAVLQNHNASRDTAREGTVALTSTGFNVTWTKATSGQGAANLAYLALKGFTATAGVLTQPTSVQQQSVDVGFVPKGVLLSSVNAVSSASAQTGQARFSLGAADGSSQGSVWRQTADPGGTAVDLAGYSKQSKAITLATKDATINAQAGVTFSGSSLLVDWTTADATQREVAYLTFGAAGISASLVSESRTSISRVSGYDSTDVVWTSSADFLSYQFRVVPSASSDVTLGTQVEANQSPTSGGVAATQYTSTLTDAEIETAMAIEGSNVVKLFVQGTDGVWST